MLAVQARPALDSDSLLLLTRHTMPEASTGNTSPVLTTVTVLVFLWALVAYSIRLAVKLSKGDGWKADDCAITAAIVGTLVVCTASSLTGFWCRSPRWHSSYLCATQFTGAMAARGTRCQAAISQPSRQYESFHKL